jgi:hypothetical protein
MANAAEWLKTLAPTAEAGARLTEEVVTAVEEVMQAR